MNPPFNTLQHPTQRLLLEELPSSEELEIRRENTSFDWVWRLPNSLFAFAVGIHTGRESRIANIDQVAEETLS